MARDNDPRWRTSPATCQVQVPTVERHAARPMPCGRPSVARFVREADGVAMSVCATHAATPPDGWTRLPDRAATPPEAGSTPVPLAESVRNWLAVKSRHDAAWAAWDAAIPTMSDAERHDAYDRLKAAYRPLHEAARAIADTLDGAAIVVDGVVVYEHFDQGATVGFLAQLAVYTGPPAVPPPTGVDRPAADGPDPGVPS